MKIKAVKTRIFKEREDLFPFILKHVKKLRENSILVIASKILALSEGRTLAAVSEKEKIKLIKKESDFALKTKVVWLTVKDNMVMANAGIDDSNSNGKLIILPKDSFESAETIRQKLQKEYKLKNLGVVISDSGFIPLRSGVIGMALGYAGFKGIKSYKGKKDLFCRKFIYSQVNIADSIATSTTLCMGEGKEQQPLAVVTDAPVVFTSKNSKLNKKEMIMNKKEDIYAPLFNKLN